MASINEKRLILPATLALAACTGVSGVEYTKVGAEPLPSGSTVALNVDLPDGEKDHLWRTARRKIRSNLVVHLLGTLIFREVRDEGEPADYRLDVVVSDVMIDQAKSSAPLIANPLADLVAEATTAFSDAKWPDRVRGVDAFVTLLDAEGGEEVTAFKISGEAGRTDDTVADVMGRIMAGLQCYGEDCA